MIYLYINIHIFLRKFLGGNVALNIFLSFACYWIFFFLMHLKIRCTGKCHLTMKVKIWDITEGLPKGQSCTLKVKSDVVKENRWRKEMSSFGCGNQPKKCGFWGTPLCSNLGLAH